MLGYLGAAQGGPAARPGVAIPRRAVPALPVAPARAATPPAVPTSAARRPLRPRRARPASVSACPSRKLQPLRPACSHARGRRACVDATRERDDDADAASKSRSGCSALVSDRTGYPADMLGLDADLEGDLGIDSIKRVEIAGTFTQSLSRGRSWRDRHRGADREQDIAGGDRHAGGGDRGSGVGCWRGAAGRARSSWRRQRPFEQGPAEQERIGRFVVHAASAPAITTTAGLAAAGAVVIVDDERGVGERAGRRALDRPGPSRRAAGARRPAAGRRSRPRSSQRSRDDHGGAKALVHLAALGDPQPQYGGLAGLLVFAQALRADLEAAATAGGARGPRRDATGRRVRRRRDLGLRRGAPGGAARVPQDGRPGVAHRARQVRRPVSAVPGADSRATARRAGGRRRPGGGWLPRLTSGPSSRWRRRRLPIAPPARSSTATACCS